ncbi:hypothetical protein SAMN05421823_11963 [Catalinimonas alkaloidigena]|uniref:Uncharacterized protein n=1 Tax=Catalinimonas alkaloidigena TaxID=1075417 RepID=A0A1G9VA39_9BACT|nr:hypothetical protein [Catalinimonas alkaloidigena]SDM68927.1 hypothetical protein SAMN05421823_11963 [Catalinimonas alkaloidigena]
MPTQLHKVLALSLVNACTEPLPLKLFEGKPLTTTIEKRQVIATPVETFDLVVDPLTHRGYASCIADNSLQVIDTQNQTLLASVALPVFPMLVRLTTNNRALVMHNTDNISVVNTLTNTVLNFAIGNSNRNVDLLPVDGRLFLRQDDGVGNTRYVRAYNDMGGNTFTGAVTIDLGAGVQGNQLMQTNGKVFANAGAFLKIINAYTNALATLPVTYNIDYMTAVGGSGKVYLLHKNDNKVTRVLTATNAIDQVWSLPPIQPRFAVVDGDYLWIAGSTATNGLVRLNTVTGEVTQLEVSQYVLDLVTSPEYVLAVTGSSLSGASTNNYLRAWLKRDLRQKDDEYLGVHLDNAKQQQGFIETQLAYADEHFFLHNLQGVLPIRVRDGYMAVKQGGLTPEQLNDVLEKEPIAIKGLRISTNKVEQFSNPLYINRQDISGATERYVVNVSQYVNIFAKNLIIEVPLEEAGFKSFDWELVPESNTLVQIMYDTQVRPGDFIRQVIESPIKITRSNPIRRK